MTAAKKANVLRLIKGGARDFERGDHVELAKHLIFTFPPEGQRSFTEGEFYAYDKSGVFLAVDRAQLSRTVQDFAGSAVGDKDLSIKAADVKGTITLASDQLADPEFFQKARPGIAFANSFVQVTADGVVEVEHSPEHRARVAYDFDYQPSEQPVRLLAFFSQVFRDDDDAPEKTAFLQELGGMSLIGLGTKYQTVALLPGGGDNGKSTAISIIERVMPQGSVVAVPPQNLDNDYRRATLKGARLNVVGELPENEILVSEHWKAAVDGITLMPARLPYGQPFYFKPIAGHLYCANRLPGTADHTRGFWRRWAVIFFNRRFLEHEKDPDIANRIIATERPAVVAWLLEGARRALAQGRYTIPKSSAAAVEAWRKSADQVSAFVDEKFEKFDGELFNLWFPADSLYKQYRMWAENNGHRPLSNVKFGERMQLLGLGSHRLNTGYVYPVRLKP